MPKGFLYHLIDYQEPVDWTGLQIREDKAWSICEDAKPIMQCLAARQHTGSICVLTLKVASKDWQNPFIHWSALVRCFTEAPITLQPAPSYLPDGKP